MSIKLQTAVDDAYDDHECANCGGEGFTLGCSWDWQCDTYDEGEGTCLCERRCEWCNPLTEAETACSYEDGVISHTRMTQR